MSNEKVMPPDFANARLRTRNVEVVVRAMPDPESVLNDADRAAPKPPFYCSSDYAEAVKVLRDEKHYSWSEVGEWFASRGVEIAWQSLRAAYYRLLLAERQEDIRRQQPQTFGAIGTVMARRSQQEQP